MKEDAAAGFVLAGGRSTRMGRDKALIAFAGRPLVARAVETLRGAGLAAAIAGERPDLAAFAPIVADRVPGLGPLGGVCAALETMPGRWGVFVTVDTPLLPAELLAHMVRRARETGAAAALVSLGGEAETFPAVLDRAMLPFLTADLEAGRQKCIRAFERAAAELRQALCVESVEAIAAAGLARHPAGLGAVEWFLNVNTPEELRRAERLAIT